tara:strand:- start:375 stop:1013 length:639 start_codon:yes stop_codon:yes gene_type:complete
MKSVSINGIARVDLGKKFAKQLRKENNVPCVIYGGTENPVHFYAHENEFRKIVYTPNVYLIDVVVGENTYKAIMGDIQFHPVTDSIVHIDFLRIFENKNIKMNIPINIIGNSIGVRNGGRLSLNMRRLLVEGLAANLPETIDVDITSLRIGHSIRVSDMSIENLMFLNNNADVIVAVKTARAAILDEEDIESEATDNQEGGSSTEEGQDTAE